MKPFFIHAYSRMCVINYSRRYFMYSHELNEPDLTRNYCVTDGKPIIRTEDHHSTYTYIMIVHVCTI